MTEDYLSKRHQSELSGLKRAARHKFIQLGIPLLVLALLFFLLPQARDRGGPPQLSVAAEKINRLYQSEKSYLEWFQQRGTSSEMNLFFGLSSSLITSAEATQGRSRDSTLNLFFIELIAAMQRILFLAIAGMRLWIVTLLLSIVWGLRKLQSYEGKDLLGVTGVGKLFYSGIRGDLSPLTKDGEFDFLIPGLACPKRVPIDEVKSSHIGKVLANFGVANVTNATLASIIIAHPEVPSFASSSNDTKLAERYQEVPLSEHAAKVLEAALLVHKEIRSGKFLRAEKGPIESSTKMNEESFISLLSGALGRVITGPMQKSLALCEPEEVAAMVLALEASKVLGYHVEGHRWVRRTNFPQLSARALLHSIPEFSKEHRPQRRRVIRQALVFASRFTVFGPIRAPRKLSEETRALRQWAEVQMALPYELAAVSDEVEFYGIAGELHDRWAKRFIGSLQAHNPEVMSQSVATETDILFISAQSFVDSFKLELKPGEFERLEQLASSINQIQRIQELSGDLVAEHGASATGRTPLPQYQRVFAPISNAEAEDLSRAHGLSRETLRLWSTLRNVLDIYGWLARRIGSESVPEHSCVMCVFKGVDPLLGGNSLSLLGKKGMIPLRGSHIGRPLGKNWQRHFLVASTASLASDVGLYEKLLTGFEPGLPEDDVIGTA